MDCQTSPCTACPVSILHKESGHAFVARACNQYFNCPIVESMPLTALCRALRAASLWLLEEAASTASVMLLRRSGCLRCAPSSAPCTPRSAHLASLSLQLMERVASPADTVARPSALEARRCTGAGRYSECSVCSQETHLRRPCPCHLVASRSNGIPDAVSKH